MYKMWGKLTGSAPAPANMVWYAKTQARTIVLYEFFGAYSYLSTKSRLLTTEQAQDTFAASASVFSTSYANLSIQEGFSDVSAVVADAIATATFSNKESFSDRPVIVSKVLVKLALAASESAADRIAGSLQSIAKMSASLHETDHDSVSFTLENIDRARLVVAEETKDSVSSRVVSCVNVRMSMVEDAIDSFHANSEVEISLNLAFSEAFYDIASLTLIDHNFKSGEVRHFTATRLVDFEFVATAPLYDSFIAAKNVSKFVAQKNYVHLYSEVPSSIFIEANKQDSATLIARRS